MAADVWSRDVELNEHGNWAWACTRCEAWNAWSVPRCWKCGDDRQHFMKLTHDEWFAALMSASQGSSRAGLG